jgi:hypothetical protein
MRIYIKIYKRAWFQKKAKHSTNGRAIKGIKERLTGKHLCSQKVTAY